MKAAAQESIAAVGLAALGVAAACALALFSARLDARAMLAVLALPAALGLLAWLLLSVRRAALFFLLVQPLGNVTLLPLASPLKVAFIVAVGAVLLRFVMLGTPVRLPRAILLWGLGWWLAAWASLLFNEPGRSTTFQLLQLSSSIAIAVFIPTLFPGLADLRRAATWLWWPGVAVTAAALLDLLRDEARIAGIFGNANMASLYINFYAPLGVYGYLSAPRGRRWPYLVGLAVSAFAFIMSGSRSGYLTVPLVLVVFAATLRPVRRMALWAAPVFLVALVLLVPRFESFVSELEGRSFYGTPSGRFKIDLSTGARILDFAAGTRMFLAHPAAGVGIGNYSANFVAYIPESLRHSQWANYVVQTGDLSSHNLLVLVGAEMGFLGLFFFSGYLLLIPLYFARAWRLLPRGPDRVLLICFIVSALGTLGSGSLHGGFAYRHFVGWYVGVAYVFWRQARLGEAA